MSDEIVSALEKLTSAIEVLTEQLAWAEKDRAERHKATFDLLRNIEVELSSIDENTQRANDVLQSIQSNIAAIDDRFNPTDLDD